MTALRTGVHESVHAGVLTDTDRDQVDYLLDRDPLVNAVVGARLAAVGTLAPHRLGGLMVGVHRGGELVGACFSGGNLLPIGGDESTWPLLAQFVANRPRSCSSIIGRADAVAAMWQVLSRVWAPARAVRAAQPLLVLDRMPPIVPDDRVQPVEPRQLERFLPAAAAMFTEELGVSPYSGAGGSLFRARMKDLISAGHAFARVDFRGQVVFKAELGAVSERTVQVQGVWVRPDLRGRGIGTAALTAVINHALTLAPTVSLYVNDYNHPARRLYAKLGMREHATLSTVLL